MTKKISRHAVCHSICNIYLKFIYTLIQFTSLRNSTYYILTVYEFEIDALFCSSSNKMRISKSTMNSSHPKRCSSKCSQRHYDCCCCVWQHTFRCFQSSAAEAFVNSFQVHCISNAMNSLSCAPLRTKVNLMVTLFVDHEKSC